MLIRKKTGDADGFSSAVCLVTCTVYDDEGPQNVVKGQEYFVQGKVDPAIFEVDKAKTKKVKEVEDGSAI